MTKNSATPTPDVASFEAARTKRQWSEMAESYSVRARRARVEQGLPSVTMDPGVLDKAARLLKPPSTHISVSPHENKRRGNAAA